MKRDLHRKWLWWALAILVVSTSYAVRELIAVEMLFATIFLLVAPVVAIVYLLQKGWESILKAFGV
jgi:hypothetical protein